MSERQQGAGRTCPGCGYPVESCRCNAPTERKRRKDRRRNRTGRGRRGSRGQRG